MNIFLFLSFSFLFIFLVGRLIEKIRVPWIFSALLLGGLLAIYNPFSKFTTAVEFNFLAELGMYLLLFMIGLEIDLSRLKKLGTFIVKSTFLITLFAAFLGSFLVYYLFQTSWLAAIIVGASFATVGEAVLVPILDEFKIINTQIGQAIIGVGTLDDIVELITLVMLMFLVGSAVYAQGLWRIIFIFILLAGLFVLTFAVSRFKQQSQRFKHWPIEILFLFTLFILFFYLGVGEYAHSAPIAALLAGVAIKTFLPLSRLQAIESEIRAVSYGFLAPIFFLWAGLAVDMRYLISAPGLIILVLAVTAAAKYIGSYLAAYRQLNLKQIILLGTGLSVRFSTSIVIIKILFENGLIASKLYSVIIATSIIFTFLVPVLFTRLFLKWEKDVISAPF